MYLRDERGGAKTREMITFLVGGQEFGIDVMSVREIRVWTPATPIAHAPSYVVGMINLPLSNFQPGDLPTGKPVVLICRSGMRSADALRRARAAGVDDIRHYRGGVIGWANGGGDLV